MTEDPVGLTRTEWVAALFELSEALDEAPTPRDVEALMAEWAARHLGAMSLSLFCAQGSRRRPPVKGRSSSGVVDVVTAAGVAARIDVPTTVRGPAHLLVTFARGRHEVSCQLQQLLAIVGKLCAAQLDRLEPAGPKARAVGGARADDVFGTSPEALEMVRLIARVADADVRVLLLGETGTGKSFAARLIHDASSRVGEPFRALNCATLGGLLEAELFGHERGAFTGADRARDGALEAAGRGTLFLDEIGELPLMSQAKLLRVLEEGAYERLGSNRTMSLRARVIAATNRDLFDLVTQRQFREDLYHRINGFSIRVPPLRERPSDVELLANRLLAERTADRAAPTPWRFTVEAIDSLRRYSWPGNVRELRTAIDYALVCANGPLVGVRDLPDAIRTAADSAPLAAQAESLVSLPAESAWLERQNLASALRVANGNKKRAASLLGINRATLYRKLAQAKPSG
jgi:DNA-binding NtrC family response regulator